MLKLLRDWLIYFITLLTYWRESSLPCFVQSFFPTLFSYGLDKMLPFFAKWFSNGFSFWIALSSNPAIIDAFRVHFSGVISFAPRFYFDFSDILLAFFMATFDYSFLLQHSIFHLGNTGLTSWMKARRIKKVDCNVGTTKTVHKSGSKTVKKI